MLLSWWSPDRILLMLLVALAIDAAVGDPSRLYRVLPHPVALMGRMIAALDAAWNDPQIGAVARAGRGALAAALVVGLAAALAWGLSLGLHRVDGGWLVEAVLASTLLAFRGLHDHVRRVAAGLESGLAPGRAAVAHIVGRDPESLDAPGIARAAIESAAENLSDGVVAPMLWYLVLGLPGLASYKAINTLDSMIGHRTPRHAAFGRVAARLDDVANGLPARLSGAAIALTALILPGMNGRSAFACMIRDAGKSRSPNAGWPEAAFAGALGLALVGPGRYGGETIARAWIGDGRRDAEAGDISRALRLYLATGGLLALALLGATIGL